VKEKWGELGTFDKKHHPFKSDGIDIKFIDREAVLRNITEHVSRIFEGKVTKRAVFYIHGTTGSGKTRVLYEWIQSSDSDYFPIAVSFNSLSRLSEDDAPISPYSLIGIRALHYILTTAGLTNGFQTFAEQIRIDIKKGVIHQDLFHVSAILREFFGEKKLASRSHY
jgi:hypothetical protein